jgi:hypothetical protein
MVEQNRLSPILYLETDYCEKFRKFPYKMFQNNRTINVRPIDSERTNKNEWANDDFQEFNKILSSDSLVMANNIQDINNTTSTDALKVNKTEQIDPRKNLMTPKRYFEEKEMNENALKFEETNNEQVIEKKRKHVRKPMPRRIQKDNLASAALRGYHIFYDEVF